MSVYDFEELNCIQLGNISLLTNHRNHRNECKCKARMTIRIVTGEDGEKEVVTEMKGTHTAQCQSRAITVKKKEGLEEVIVENASIEKQFEDRVKTMATTDLHLTPGDIYRTVRDEFLAKGRSTISMPCAKKVSDLYTVLRLYHHGWTTYTHGKCFPTDANRRQQPET